MDDQRADRNGGRTLRLRRIAGWAAIFAWATTIAMFFIIHSNDWETQQRPYALRFGIALMIAVITTLIYLQTRKYCNVRVVWSLLWGVACLLLISLPLRVHSRVNEVSLHFSDADSLYINVNVWRVRIGFWHYEGNYGPEITSYSFDSSRLYLLLPKFTFVLTSTPPNNSSAVLTFPYWFAVAMFCAIAAVPWIRWRFSLSTLLIAMTLVAVAVYLLGN